MNENSNDLKNTEILLNALLPFAQQQLEKNGDFAPFGARMSEDKEASMAMATSDEKADSQKMIEMITEGFKSKIESDKLIAIGLCFNAVVDTEDGKKDAICIALECIDDKPLNLFLPYKKNFFTGKISYGELSANSREATVFTN